MQTDTDTQHPIAGNDENFSEDDLSEMADYLERRGPSGPGAMQ